MNNMIGTYLISMVFTATMLLSGVIAKAQKTSTVRSADKSYNVEAVLNTECHWHVADKLEQMWLLGAMKTAADRQLERWFQLLSLVRVRSMIYYNN